ncbi:MAG: heparinase II/III family protein [Alphaproteobacteria bacterium]
MPAREATYPHRIAGGGRALAEFAEHLRALTRLPAAQALALLTYDLKRPIFALPFYRLSLPGVTPLALAVSPSDAWPGDAKLGREILRGCFNFAGCRIATPAPLWAPLGAEPGWLAELHGFAWLRDLRAVGGDGARRHARELVGAWLATHESWSAIAWDPLTTGRRLSHWLGCYEFFAASAEISFRHRLHRSMTRQAQHLGRVLPAGLAGADLIAALKGLIYAGVCLPDSATWREQGLTILHRELPRQILSDGLHVERNPARHMAVLRDLIDLRALLHKGEVLAGRGAQGLAGRGTQGVVHAERRGVPAGLQAAVEAMAPALSMFQHGDGGLAVFNGSTEEEGWQVDMVLQRATGRTRAQPQAPEGGFHRLCAGRTLILVDAGAPPPPGLDRVAHAGTLGLEISIGRERMIVNCGARPGDPGWRQAQRATAAHSTLTVGDTNSGELLKTGGFGRRPHVRRCKRTETDGNLWLDMSHDGYRRAFGLRHRRRLFLAADGADVRGEDRLQPRNKSRPCDFAVRFHLHPDVKASVAQGGDSALLHLEKNGAWELCATGARVSLEPSVYLGRKGEVRRSQQIVLTGHAGHNGASVKWALRRIEPPTTKAHD